MAVDVQFDDEAIISLTTDALEVDELMEDTAQQMADIARAHAPVATGYLRDNIDVEEGDTKGSKYVVSRADYTEPVEFGTRYMAAQPFMRPAMDAVRV